MSFLGKQWTKTRLKGLRSVAGAVNRCLALGPHVFLGAIFFPLVLIIALVERLRVRYVGKPQVLFGITPIITNKYWARALRTQGYQSFSFVYGTYSINSPGDFDYVPEKLFPSLPRNRVAALFLPYLCFLWVLVNFEILVLDFDGGFLRSTPFRFLEFPILALAGRKIVGNPYGGDVLDVRRCRDPKTRAALLQDGYGRNLQDIERRIAHYTRWASFMICCGYLVDFLPRCDLLVTSTLAIDTEQWSDNRQNADTTSPIGGKPVKILHAPNHRAVKGTQYLIQACKELQAEGVPVELTIKERVPNSEIRKLMREVDIIASGFITGYYELFALEGMSMSKPVLNYWRPDLKHIYSTYSYASDCPIVDTSVADLKKNITMLVENPDKRKEIGEAGRSYVQKYHSYPAVGRLFDKIVRKVWFGDAVGSQDATLRWNP